MAFGGLAALWDPNEHPRGWHGRFVRKFKLAPWLDNVLRNFRPRQWHSDGQAASYTFNMGHKSPKGAFNALEMKRVHSDWDEAQDHIRAGDIDPSTKAFMDTMDGHFQDAPEAMIVGRTFTPDGLGLQPQQLNTNDPNGITRFMGNTLADKGYFPGHVGTNNSHGPGKITMSLAVPKGTRVAFSGQNQNDRGVFMEKGQRVLVTQVNPDGQGGWYMMAVVEPKGGPSGTPAELIPGRKGAGLSPEQREAKIAGRSVLPQPAEPPQARQPVIGMGGKESVLPAQVPERTPAQKAAKATRRQGYEQARQAEGNAPSQPQPVQPTPTPVSGVGERTEPVHGPIGGVSTEGKSASEIAQTPAPAAPETAQAVPAQRPFTDVFRESGLKSPSAGPQRREFNNALMGLKSGHTSPEDALRELDADIDANDAKLKSLPDNDPKKPDLRQNIEHQRNLADLIATHFNEPRMHKQTEVTPEAPTPAPAKAAKKVAAKAAEAAPEVKKGFSTVKELSPDERKDYDALDQLGRSRYLARRRAGQGHDAALGAVKGKEPAPAPAKKAAAKVAKAEQVVRGEAVPRAAEARKAAKAGKAAESAAKAPPEIPEDISKRPLASVRAIAKEHGIDRDENGKLRPVKDLRADLEARRTGGAAKKAVPEAPAKAAPAKVAKVAKAAPAPKAVSEVQTRADEAGLPNTVTALRQAAREKKIRGFSTMNKEQLQRALLGEEVGTGGKLGAIAPEKLVPHLKAANTDQAARNLLEDHTVADLKALAKANDVPNASKLTTKDKLKDGIIKHLRGEEPSALRPEMPKESLAQQMKDRHMTVPGNERFKNVRDIVNDVDDSNPTELRQGRDDLEKIANDTKTSDPDISKVAQDAADAMGMRAQEITGVEEAPAPVKGAKKVAKKAAAPKLSVHQERVRKQHIADGMDEAEARRLAEEAPVRAPAGTKAAAAKATAARKAAGLPESRREKFIETGEFVPGPKLTAPRKAAAPGPTVAREGLTPSGERRISPEGEVIPDERLLRNAPQFKEPSGRTGPQRTVVQKAFDDAGIKDDAGGLKPSIELDLKQGVPPAKVAGKVRREADNIEAAGKIPETGGTDPVTATRVKREMTAERAKQLRKVADSIEGAPESEPKSVRVRKAIAKNPEIATVPGTSAAERSPTEVKKVARKAVPEGSVKGERAQAPISNTVRAADFDAAYMDHIKGRGARKLSEATITNQDEISGDISEGRITPEEGIRKIESEIEFNNNDINDLARDIRTGKYAEGADLDRARTKLNRLERDKADNENFSHFLHGHFGKERVTPDEVIENINETLPGFWERLNKEDPEEYRKELEAMPELQHLGPFKGNTTQEIFKDALAKTIKHGLEQRAAKATKKAATPRVPRGTPKPEFEPGGQKHLDAKAIAGDLDIPEKDIALAQEKLNSGKSPGEVAKSVRFHADRMRDSNAIINGTHGALGPMPPERHAELNAEYEKGLQNAAKMDAFADRLAGTRRPTVRKAAPAKAVEQIAEAKAATKEPRARKALNQAEKAVKQSDEEMANLKERVVGRHRDAFDKASTREEAQAAADAMRKDLTVAEIRELFGKNGIRGRSKDDILTKAIDQKFGGLGGRAATPAKIKEVNDRFAEGKRVSSIGAALAHIDDNIHIEASEAAMRNNVQSHSAMGGFDPKLAKRLEDAAVKRDRTALDKIAAEHGLTRNTGAPGEVVPFDGTTMRGIAGGGFRKGEAVHIVRPGYRGTVQGRDFQATAAVVEAATPEEKQGMLERLGTERRAAVEALRGPGREVTPEMQQEVVQRLSRPRVRGKGAIAAPEELPLSKEEELKGNLARLEAAKAPKPGDHAAVEAHLRGLGSTEEGHNYLKALKMTAPETRALGKALGTEPGPRDSKAKMEEAIVRHHVTRRLEHAAYLRRANPVTSTGAPEHGKLEGAALAKAAPALPGNQTIADKLRGTTSVEEGGKYLNDLKLSAPETRDLAKHLGIRTTGNESKLSMNNKILRRTVTTRLEHKAYEGRGAPNALPAPEKGIQTLAKGGFNEPFIGGGAPVKSGHIRDFGPGLEQRLGRTGGDETLRMPNGGADQGLIHMDSTIGQLWTDLASDGRTKNSTLNQINDIGNQLGQGRVDLPTARALIRDIKPGDSALRDRINKAVGDLEVKPSKVDVPDNTPKAVRDLLDNLNEIPAYHNKGSLSHGAAGATPFEQITKLVRDIGNGDEGPGGDTKLLRAVENPHESGDGVYEARRAGAKLFFPGNQSPEVRNWFRSWRNKEQGGEAPKAPEPVKAAPAKAARAKPITALELNRMSPAETEEAVTSGKLTKARALEKLEADTKQLRDSLSTTLGSDDVFKEPGGGTVGETIAKRQDLLRRTEALSEKLKLEGKTPTKRAAKKAAPAKVTQAELRNPVEKVGAAAPSATPSQIQAKGLATGEGIPTSPLLAAKNKLGTGNAGTLTKLDTAVRIPARHGDIPQLLRDLQEQLQRAGVGPNDEPRKTLVAWFHEHFNL